MSIIFKPNGSLDVSSAATDLPEQSDGKSSVSQAFARAINLSLDRLGQAATRPGSTAVGSAVPQQANHQIVQNGVRFAFSSTQIYRNSTAIATGLAAGTWSALLYNQFNDTDQQVFAINGSERKRINGTDVFEWGIAAPADEPTLAVGALTGLTGDYNVRYTYLRKVGATVVSESNPSPVATAAVTLSNESLDITWTASTDPQVTHVRIYRTLANDSNYYVDQDVAIGSVTVDSDTADSALGAQVATDHTRPPAGQVCLGPVYNGVVFIADGHKLHWSKSKQPEYFPTTNFIEVGESQYPIRALATLDGQVYAATDIAIYWIQGALSGSYNPIRYETKAGTPNLLSFLPVKGAGLFHVGHDGIYLFAGGVDKKVTEQNFEPLFRGTAAGGMPAVPVDDSRWLARYENRVYFHYGNGNCLVLNLDQNRWGSYKWDRRMYAPAYDDTNKRLLAVSSARVTRHLEDRAATDDNGTDIAWTAQSKDFTLQTRRHFPRWVKYDVSGAATGTLLLDDSAHQTHTLAGTRNTRRRLVKEGNGVRCAIRLTGTGAATVYAVEME